MKAGTNEAMVNDGTRRVLLVGDTTLDPLARLLDRSQDTPNLRSSAAQYGQVYQVLLDSNHSDWTSKPEYLVVWTTPQLTLPSLGKLMQFQPAKHEDVLREAEQFAELVCQASKRVSLVLVTTWILPNYERCIQTLAWRPGVGLANLLAKANLILAERLAAERNIVLLDAGYWQASLGKPAQDPRMYAAAKILYSPALFEKAATEIKAVLRGVLGYGKKVIVCDLDNTLWGGVIGDDGPHAIRLGPPDPVGECFQSFQMVLKRLRARGIVLTICSKNEEEFAMSVIGAHPAMKLRKDDFASWRINWRDKAENLLSLAEELSLGLDSFVFLDDSPQEREQIRQILPQVYTPDLPTAPSDLAPFLSSLTCFETTSIGREDLERTGMYQAERGRKEALELSGDIDKWLQTLQIEVHATPLKQENLARAAQLLNKTNQFNLSLRRLEEESFWKWVTEPGNAGYVFHVSDRFGDSGLVALATFSRNGAEARIMDFVMSCRVMGKKVEEALLGYTLGKARASGAVRVLAQPVQGPRNSPAREFFAAKCSGADAAAIDPTHVEMPSFIRLREES